MLKRCWCTLYNIPIIPIVNLVYVGCNSWTSTSQPIQFDSTMPLDWHPRVNPDLYLLLVYRLLSEVKRVVDLKLDLRSPLDVELLQVTGKGSIGPHAHLRCVSLGDVDVRGLQLVGDEQLRSPDLRGDEVDHGNATPQVRVPCQVVVHPTHHYVPLEDWEFMFVVHLLDVIDVHLSLDNVVFWN